MSWGHLIGGLFTLVLAGVAVAAVIAILTYEEIINWFNNRSSLLERDRQNIGFSIIEHLNNGNYRTVQGIFNQSTQQVLDSRSMESRRIDSEMAKMHRETGYVIYTLDS